MKTVQPDRRLCVAPMMMHTDRHFRFLLRLLSRHVMLYTEMITTGAVIHGRQHHRLRFNDEEHPVGIQLGGNDPADLARCAGLAEDMGYDEVNLNIGCPSDKIRTGQFGACLMAQPELVAACIEKIKERVRIPVTVKTRTGIDDVDSYEHLYHFIRTITDSGCQSVILHARKAWLKGLSPKQNRDIPPLDYETVYRIKTDFPKLEVIINGGIDTLEQAHRHLCHVDGVMIGRAVCNNPYMLAAADRQIFDSENPLPVRHTVLQAYMHYMEEQLTLGVSFQQMSRHILGLFQGVPGARAWRRSLSENACKDRSGIDVIENALGLVEAA